MSEPLDRRLTMLVEGRRLVLESGYTATSIDAICEAAHVTKGAFFHHFASKDQFASELLAHTWQPVLDAHEPDDDDADVTRRLSEHIRFMAVWIADEGRLMPMLAQEVGSSNPQIRAQVRSYFETWMAILERLLVDAVTESEVDVDVQALKEFIIATTEGIPVAIGQFGPQALANVSERLVTSVLNELT